jgi:hypothetical protein
MCEQALGKTPAFHAHSRSLSELRPTFDARPEVSNRSDLDHAVVSAIGLLLLQIFGGRRLGKWSRAAGRSRKLDKDANELAALRGLVSRLAFDTDQLADPTERGSFIDVRSSATLDCEARNAKLRKRELLRIRGNAVCLRRPRGA